MDDIEYARVYQQLAAMLDEFNLGWVAQQVADNVEIGKTIEERSLKRKTPLLKIEDYTPQEQLLMLIDAVEQATVHTSEMEDEIAYFLKVESETSPLGTKISFGSSSAQEVKTIEFTSHLTSPRNKQAIALKYLLEKLPSEPSNYITNAEIKSKLSVAINPDFNGVLEQANIFDVYLFTILLKAIANEGATIYYNNVLDETPKYLTFRKTPGKIHGNTHPYTYAIVEFPDKPALEVHLAVKVQGRAGVLHNCNLLMLYQKEANICRLLQREPRHSQVILAVKSQHNTSELKLETAGAFIGLASDIRYEGGSYFISNTYSEAVAKLLTIARKKWELNIFPRATNDVHRLMYSFQTIFKDFKARN
ncbi:MAG: hypothetical protein EAZ78_07185 [Oscillatoriales cyanobacterium]|uniref:Uncharacterized protein n=1 Tax=Microcoleus anatoxicus PTRS2 TaxID=2705321 RepID=A0ABU8YNG7_9CYAN|nr:MAG: hypothetical protein EA000_24195 [Oscillatoriales cyanobacterium]TAF04923.1 MAG: hypothetical protein EAZ78_07185 [Oscillatoriales cyanobacterium]TAF37009.1 MAG: hypothetical protein EAZ68_15585 [Oscillatoriales cyanobacterium]TAF64884.1 MAG: hypothetical protein EAZ59_17355 [Oscillatoriales cyanobacterium]